MSSQSLCRYAVYLAQRLHYASISKYLNVLRILHLDLNMDNPLKDNWFLNTVLKGIRRDNPRSPRRKLPITPDVLLSIKRILDMDKPVDIMFWAACVVAFFGFFRKSNLLPRSRLDMGQCFVRGDLRKSDQGFLLHVTRSKTIQFHQREYLVPLVYLQSHPLCPVSALCDLLLLSPTAPSSVPLLSFTTLPELTALTQCQFTSKLQACIQSLGYNPREYSAHSLRRGAASWAFQAGLPGEIIQTLGDWRSDAYKLYLEIQTETKFKYAKQFSKTLPSM
jgi:hypothetical protein